MKYEQAMDLWLKKATDDPGLGRELSALRAGRLEEEIEDRFYRELSFGTGGLRGLIGAGTNRMNIYTVGRATQGLANHLRKNKQQRPVAIAYDSRVKSDIFAQRAARVLAANGVFVWLFPRLMPTPALSFAVRHLGCAAGICVTASHNPAEYNGYKVYGPDGGQITDEAARQLAAEIDRVDTFEGVKLANFERGLDMGLIRYIEEETVDAFLDAVYAQRVGKTPMTGPLKVVYTPLNGTGRECVLRVLERAGVAGVTLVPQQAHPDGSFATCPSPNPENPAALHLGLELAAQTEAELLLATDPDCDRVGVAVRDGEGYRRLTGNEVGVLLLDYICQRRRQAGAMPPHPMVYKTIVTTGMAKAVAEDYGAKVAEVLTGFKYIGEQIGLDEKNNRTGFIFGFEESCGYLSGSYVRDKDAVAACLLICDMARWHKAKGQTLADAMDGLYAHYGAWANSLHSFEYDGAAGTQQMQEIMFELRAKPPRSVAGMPVRGVTDYLVEDTTGAAPILPPANVLCFHLRGGGRVFVRPSGTEPKVKLYVETTAPTRQSAACLNARVADGMAGYLAYKNPQAPARPQTQTQSPPGGQPKGEPCLSSSYPPPAKATFGAAQS